MRGSPFFEDVAQMELTVRDEYPSKLPVFYYDAGLMAAAFPARLGRLRRLMPDPRFSPARLAPGLGVVAIICLEYRDCDVGAYNELAIAVLLNEPAQLVNLPGRALLRGRLNQQMHGWIQHLPVTTDFAVASGVDLFNFPKFLAGIDFSAGGTQCRLTEGEEHILTLTGARIPTPDSSQMQVFSHAWMDRQPQSSEFKANLLDIGESLRPGAATLTLGDGHPIARELAGLLVSRRSIQYQLVPRFEAMLYGPAHLSLPQLAIALERYDMTTTTPAA